MYGPATLQRTTRGFTCRPSIACGNEEDHKGLPQWALRGECTVFRRIL